MKNKLKILHFSDPHYDEKNHKEIAKCIDSMISEAEEKQPDVIVCSGDVTNSEYLAASTNAAKAIFRQFRALSDIAPVAVTSGTPSHDGQTPELLGYVSGKYPIYVSTKPEQIYLLNQRWFTSDEIAFAETNKDDISLVVTQIPAPTKEFWKNRQGAEQDNLNIAEAMGAIFAGFGASAKLIPNAPHVMNGHFSMKGSKITETQLLPGSDIAIGSEILALAGCVLYMLGHIHFAQVYKILGKENCFHAGSTYRKNFGERNEDKGFYIHSLDGGELNSEFILVPTRSMFQSEINLIETSDLLEIDPETNEDFSLCIAKSLKKQCEAGDFIKIVITVYIDDIRLINQAKLKRLLLEAGASDVLLDLQRIRRENSNEEAVLKAVSLPDKFEALAKDRSQPLPDGVIDFLEKVATLNEVDLVEFALKRLA